MMDNEANETELEGPGKDETEAHENAEVLSEFNARFKASKDHFKDWRQEARELYDFKSGDHWSDEDRDEMSQKRKPVVTFNLAEKFIDAIVGLQINNRQEIRYFPRENGDVGVSDLATGAVKWNRDLSDAEDEETDAFGDVILVGMGYIEHRLEDTIDSEGYIEQRRIDPLECYPDPTARKRNLSDARYIIRMVPYTPEQYEEEFGEDSSELEDSPEFTVDTADDPKLIRVPQDYQEDEEVGNEPKSRLYVGQYQWWELEDKYLVEAAIPDPATGQPKPTKKEFTEEEWTALEPRLQQMAVPYNVRKTRVRCYYQAFITGGGVKNKVKLPTSGFTIKAITGKRDRNKGTWYGIGRNIRDPNLWVNKFFSSILWTLSVNPKGGLLAESDAFDDVRKAEASWADPSMITFTAPGAIMEGKIKDKPPTAYPQGMDRLMQFSLQALPEVSGLNLELMGLADRQQSGVLEAQRKQSAMAIIAWAFDAMRRYYKESGRIMLELIREYMADGRLIRINGESSQQYVQLFRDKLSGTYDIVVDEAPTSTNMRERVWSVLQEIIPIAMQSGIKVPKEVLDYAPLPEDLAQKWKKGMQPSPEEQQQQQKQIELLVKEAMAKIAKDQSQALLNQAKAEEIKGTAPAKIEGQQIENMKTAAEAGALQAGG